MASSSQDGANGPFDLLLLMDATSSMGTFIQALNKALPEVVSISALTGCFERIGVLAYRDYCDKDVTEWSGWCSPTATAQGVADVVSQDDVLKMARNMRPLGGGDWPEATKTGLAKAHSVMRPEATTIILLYADAPPHFKDNGDGHNYRREKKVLEDKKASGKDAKLFVDWISAAKTLRSGPKKAVVFSMIQKINVNALSPYLYLSTVTGGALFQIQHTASDKISQLTIGVLLTWMRLGKTVADAKTPLGYFTRYKSTGDILTAKKEEDELAQKYISTGQYAETKATVNCTKRIESESISLGAVPRLVKIRGPQVESFADKYAHDAAYKSMAVRQLKLIIESNVAAISLNPIFGSLWRAVCNDRVNPMRDELIQLFGLHVDRISDQAEKTRMKAWLEESYNYATEINFVVKAVAPPDRFPMVFLDPTADFGFVEDAGGEPRRLQDFTRPELLEIGRSCDYKILRRLGKVLTRLTYVRTEAELPHHIQTMDPQHAVPCVPLSLAREEYNREFWKVLLHAVLPGTKLAARPAALLAALALRMGIAPLREVADAELLAFSTHWNSLAIPETWNLGCLGLLLDADKDYEKRVAEGVTARPTDESRVLSTKDRDTFTALVEYKMLELNLDTGLEAQITWTPAKTKVALGPLVVCKRCLYPRSVTVMAPGGICGLCDAERGDGCSCSTCAPADDHAERVKTNVSADQTETSDAYWVECSQSACRAQYVVYNPNALRVRPKCFFCRHARSARNATGQDTTKDVQDTKKDVGKAPTVECATCLGRIIWPQEYRPDDLDVTAYQCPACVAGRKTIVGEETTARKLSDENGWEWLLRNDDKTIRQPFNGRTVFYTASNCNLDAIDAKVEILPASSSASSAASETPFTIRGKLVRNPEELRASLLNWVRARRTESATCSLCFSSVRKGDVLPACGRSGCHQLICAGCRDSWYGINAPGRILNLPALHCPFCRRRPAPRAIGKFRLHQIGALRAAVDEGGAWIYAWCRGCGFAKPYVERVCAAGAPAELVDWTCEACQPELELELVVGRKRIRRCPGCGVATEKTYGCDHITCPCGTHWCYACGRESDQGKIYEHMAREHGGLEWGGDDED